LGDYLMPAGIISLISFVLILVLTPLLFMEVMLIAFHKLGISPIIGLFIVVGIFLGSLFNLPIKRYRFKRKLDSIQPLLFGTGFRFPRKIIDETEVVIAVNVGGCIIPVLIVFYELIRLVYHGVYIAPLIAIFINIGACFTMSRSVKGVGVVIPAFLPGLLAAFCGLLLYPENSPAVAFCAGVLGPVIGADLLKLREFISAGSGLISIGGAGSFDGIVISGIVALLLS